MVLLRFKHWSRLDLFRKLLTVYCLWLTLGMVGMHHFYLRRDRHAFVWFCTLGGFLLGWLRDAWYIPAYLRQNLEDEDSYVSEDNHDTDYAYLYEHTGCCGDVGLLRLGGMFTLGYLYGYLVLFTYPPLFTPATRWQWSVMPLLLLRGTCVSNDILGIITFLQQLILASAVAYGVHMVGNIGRLRASFFWCLAGSLAGVMSQGKIFNLGFSSFCSTAAVYLQGLKWKSLGRQPYQRLRKRLHILARRGTIYLGLWACTVHFSSTVTPKEAKERAVLAEFLYDLRDSAEWAATKENVQRLCRDAFHKAAACCFHLAAGVLQSLWKGLQSAFDFWADDVAEPFAEPFADNESDPYKILGVSRSASQGEIRRAYTNLVKLWHPDKHKTQLGKQRANHIFIQIQAAFEKLSVKSKWKN